MSGIYIKGMEMPEEDEISKCIIIRYDGEVWVVEFDNLISEFGYVACYPTNPITAIPVPKHGRLIDGDALYAWSEAQEIPKEIPIIIPADKEGEG